MKKYIEVELPDDAEFLPLSYDSNGNRYTISSGMKILNKEDIIGGYFDKIPELCDSD